MHLLYIAVGGALGSLLRHFAAMILTQLAGTWLPWGIMAVNVTGSFVIGLAAGSLVTIPEGVDTTAVRYFVIVGLCGGYTTFSSFSLYTLQMLQVGMVGRALLHVLLSVLGCVVATAVGYAIAAAIAR
jgi:CrcB protein